MEETASASPNLYRAWLTIWYAPRQTIRRISEKDPEFAAYLIVTLYVWFYTGIFSRALRAAPGITRLQGYDLLAQVIGWILSLLICGVIGRIFLYSFSACVYWLGKAFGNHGNYLSTIGAVSWSLTPGLPAAVVLSLLKLFFHGSLLWQFLLVVVILMLCWQAVILTLGIVEVQEIPAKTASMRMILASLMMSVLLAGSCGILIFALRLFSKSA